MTIKEAPPVARKTPMTALSVAITTRDEINRLALETGANLGRRVSHSLLVAALCRLGRNDPAALTAALHDLISGETEGDS